MSGSSERKTDLPLPPHRGRLQAVGRCLTIFPSLSCTAGRVRSIMHRVVGSRRERDWACGNSYMCECNAEIEQARVREDVRQAAA